MINFKIFNNSIINNYFAFFTKLIICLTSAIYFLFIASSLKYQKLTFFEYLLILLSAILDFIVLYNSYYLLTAYSTIELSSISSYILTSFKRNSYIYGISNTINL